MRLLLLAGTQDARRITEALCKMVDLSLIASLAGETRNPAPLPCETRIGGFGGRDGFKSYLAEHDFDAVINATHPFAGKMSKTAHEICSEIGVSHLRYLRPEWHRQPNDNWIMVDEEAGVAEHIPQGSRVFLATGHKTLEAFANLASCYLVCRQIDPAERPFPFPNGQFLIGRPPFTVAEEIALFRKLGIDWLVVKNSGGTASRSKLDAARVLGLPVAMIKRPDPPDAPIRASIEDVINWVEALKGRR